MSVVGQLFELPPNADNIAGTIHDELLNKVSEAPILDHKTKHMIPVLEELFKGVDWGASFETPLLIIYDETITKEILIGIHTWLRTKCTDIENITLITSHHCGVQRWWKQWCEIEQERSFSIIEASFGYSYYTTGRYKMEKHPVRYPLPSIPSSKNIADRKNIMYYFNMYGGTYPTLERLYITTRLLEFREYGIVEYIGDMLSKQDILNYAENITYFKNQKEIDTLSKIYDRFVIDNRIEKQQLQFDIEYLPVKNEHFFSGYQYCVDSHCFANVTRETINFHPYTTVTEKTLRSFLHHLAVIPTSYRSVDDLEAQGFWFPHDIIDYNYQYELDHGFRMDKLIQSLRKMINKFSIDDLKHYYQENLNYFHHNAKLVYDIIQDPFITYRKLNK